MAALIRLIFMFVLVIVVVMIIIVVVMMMFMERAFFCVQGLVYDNANCRCTCVRMVVVIYLQNQSCFTFLDSLQVETPATAGVYVKNFFVGDFPGEGMLVIRRGFHFFFIVVKELHGDVFTHAVCIHVHHFDRGIGLAAINAVGELPVSPIKVPAFGFKVFVLVGRGTIAVATGGKEYAKDNGKKCRVNGFEIFHFSLDCLV